MTNPPIAVIVGREMGTAGLGRMKWCDNAVFVLIANMCGMEREPLCLLCSWAARISM